jgi:hypothetical protein
MFQHRLVTVTRQPLRLGCADFIDRLVHLGHDVEPVQDMHRLASLLGDYLEVRLPHVAAHKLQQARTLLAEHAKEPQEGLGRSVFANPQ